MSDGRLKVGISALFDPADTPHARTFMRALATARNTLPALAQVEWHFLDDGAHRERGADVARAMVQWGADIVVGHFSSDAALGAVPIYRAAGIALLTPAATLDRLTLDHHNVFRFCPSDRQLARDLLRFIRQCGWQSVHIDADGSAHGQALAQAIAAAASKAGLRQLAGCDQAEVEVFAGRLRASREHWQGRRAAGSRGPLILTDDAASPYLGVAASDDRNTWVIGFGAVGQGADACPATRWHLTLFDGLPQSYYRESLLLFQVLGQLAGRGLRRTRLLDALNHSTWRTPLGDVGFDQGECRGACNRVWHLGPNGLLPVAD
ncbi:ABC transporter substrate-binding protein [Pseudomonas sp. Pseusp122]|uniref:ABC transporter substrate-binding protein n=1 Tax=unclassified Pseudomonas TaxID=196821 RepID=UPI0039A6D81B